MTIGREILRRQAKKVYKENTKKVPKRKRIPFSQFFKEYKKNRNTDQTPDVVVPESDTEDFDFGDMVNINEIDDDGFEDVKENNELEGD